MYIISYKNYKYIEFRESFKLVEKTFGDNSFRVLGNMNREDSSAVITMELLKNMRRGVLKNGE